MVVPLSPETPVTAPVSVDQALRVAQQDAEQVYGDLTLYRIQIVLIPAGWLIDYEFASSSIQGGGPHYLIDATTGVIISKRYEQ
jgi:hypothetical protein